MSIQVVFNNQVVFDVGAGENVLVPFSEDERAKAFYALTGALAVLSGVTPLYQSAATEAGWDGHCSEIEQHPAARKGGVVVPLRGQRAGPAGD